MGPGNSRELQIGYGQASLYVAFRCENASTFPSLFSPRHHPMKQENELGVLASLLDLLPLISVSPHSWLLSFVL